MTCSVRHLSRPAALVGTIALMAALVGACSRQASPSATTVNPMVTWCALAVEMTAFADEQASATATGADSQREALDRLAALLNKGRDIAPPEIEADVATAADRVSQVAGLLGSVGYDNSLLTDDLLAEYDIAAGELAQASAVITDFNRRYCGVGTDNPRRDQAIAELVASGFSDDEANCLYDAFASRSVAGETSLPNAQPNPQQEIETQEIEALFSSCGISVDRLNDWVAANGGLG